MPRFPRALLRSGVEIVRLPGAQRHLVAQSNQHGADRTPIHDPGAEIGGIDARQVDQVEPRQTVAAGQIGHGLRREIAGEFQHHFVRYEALLVRRRDIDVGANRGRAARARAARAAGPAAGRRARRSRNGRSDCDAGANRNASADDDAGSMPGPGPCGGRGSRPGPIGRSGRGGRVAPPPSLTTGGFSPTMGPFGRQRPSPPGLVAAASEPTFGPRLPYLVVLATDIHDADAPAAICGIVETRGCIMCGCIMRGCIMRGCIMRGWRACAAASCAAASCAAAPSCAGTRSRPCSC